MGVPKRVVRATNPMVIPIAVPIVCGVASRAIQADCKLMMAWNRVSFYT
jgi:hypothetical protein